MSQPTMNPQDELDSSTFERDDTIIAKALKWSLAVIALLGVAGGAGAYWLLKAAPKPVVKTMATPPVTVRAKPALDLPEIRFTDVTADAGLRFVHENGAYGDKLLPETMGSGCAFLDYDNDGDQDILFVNSCRWPWDPPKKGITEEEEKKLAKPTQALYRNMGQGRFVDVTKEA